MTVKNDKLEEKLKDHLKSWNDDIPPSIAGRLRAARHEALSTAKPRRSHWWLPAVGIASVAFAALVTLRIMPTEQTALPLPIVSAQDVVLLTDEDELDLLENVDFMLWLSEIDDVDLG